MPAFAQAKSLIFLDTRFTVDEYRAVFPVNVTSPHQDRHAIEQLFGKIAQVEGQARAPDAQAAEFIRSQINRQPNAPYYMAQTIVVQEQALNAAHGRIQQLEQELASRPAGGGGFLSGLFGGGQARPQQHPSYQPQQPYRDRSASKDQQVSS